MHHYYDCHNVYQFVCFQISFRHKRGGGTTNSGYAALKILGKHDVIRLKQVEHVKNERQILSDIKVGEKKL